MFALLGQVRIKPGHEEETAVMPASMDRHSSAACREVRVRIGSAR